MSQTYSDVFCATSETNTLAIVSSPKARAFMMPDMTLSQFLSYCGHGHDTLRIFHSAIRDM